MKLESGEGRENMRESKTEKVPEVTSARISRLRTSERGAYMLEYILPIVLITLIAIPALKRTIAPMVLRPTCEVMEGLGHHEIAFQEWQDRWVCVEAGDEGWVDLFTGATL